MTDKKLKEKELLLEEIRSIATGIWFKLVNSPGGHPGCPGPSSNKDDDWSNKKAVLMQIKTALKEVDEMIKHPGLVREIGYTGFQGQGKIKVEELGVEGAMSRTVSEQKGGCVRKKE